MGVLVEPELNGYKVSHVGQRFSIKCMNEKQMIQAVLHYFGKCSRTGRCPTCCLVREEAEKSQRARQAYQRKQMRESCGLKGPRRQERAAKAN